MHAMTVADVMTKDVVTAAADAPFVELVAAMEEQGISGVPIVDATGKLAGIVTEADLLRVVQSTDAHRTQSWLSWLLHPGRAADAASHGRDLRAADLMTRNVVTVTPSTTVRKAARTLLQAKLRRLVVIDDQWRVAGIVSRRDLLDPFLRPDDEIRREITQDVVVGVMWIDPRTVTVAVHDGVVTLGGRVSIQSQRDVLESFVRRLDGVVGVVNTMEYDVADRDVSPAPARTVF